MRPLPRGGARRAVRRRAGLRDRAAGGEPSCRRAAKNQSRFRFGQEVAGFSMSHMSETYGRLPGTLLLSVALLRSSSLAMPPLPRTRTISVFAGARGPVSAQNRLREAPSRPPSPATRAGGLPPRGRRRRAKQVLDEAHPEGIAFVSVRTGGDAAGPRAAAVHAPSGSILHWAPAPPERDRRAVGPAGCAALCQPARHPQHLPRPLRSGARAAGAARGAAGGGAAGQEQPLLLLHRATINVIHGIAGGRSCCCCCCCYVLPSRVSRLHLRRRRRRPSSSASRYGGAA